MYIIDGKKLALKREEKLKRLIKKLKVKPKVVSILIGDDPPSVLYTNLKQKKAAEVGIEFKPIRLPVNTEYEVVKNIISELNSDKGTDGIMVQLPLPKEFLGSHDSKELIELIDPKKDIDGLTSKRLVPPAAVKASLSIIKDEKIKIKGKKAVVLGASNLVGKPMGEELKKRGAKVVVCNSKTPNIKKLTLKADIVVGATGRPGIVTGDMVSEGVAVIDIGAEKVKDKVVGDVEFESVAPRASKITPVPGGVGPMTVVSLMENIVDLYKKNRYKG